MLFGTLDHISPISGNIVGRSVSHYEFIKALIKYSSFSEYHFFLGDNITCKETENALSEIANITENVKKVKLFKRNEIPRQIKHRDYTIFHKHDPQIDPLCYMRETFAHYPFPITGIIHSISYQRLQQEFFKIISSKTYPFDTIICTSPASKIVMQNLFESISNNFKKNLNLTLTYNGRFDSLPLGVDIGNFISCKNEEKGILRKRLKLPEKGTLLLTISRFSQYSKMDMYPIINKLSSLISNNTSLYYIIAGSAYESNYPEKLKEYGRNLGIEGKIIILKDINEKIKKELYQSCDIFISPSDNHQESFGLTLLEAMASALPVIASNWNGYKDLIEDGATGLLVDTIWGECDELITDLAPISFEREYHLHLGQSVAVNLDHLEKQIEKLIKNKSLRLEMGNNARNCVEKLYSWEKVIEKYEKLVKKLKSDSELPGKMENKKRDYLFLLKYFDVFKHYPSRIINDEDFLVLSEYGKKVINKKAKIIFYDEMENILNVDIILLILQNIFNNKIKVSEIKIILKNKYSSSKITYTLLWMLKYDFLKLLYSTPFLQKKNQ